MLPSFKARRWKGSDEKVFKRNTYISKLKAEKMARIIDKKFSDELKLVISASREIALELGYEQISTIHFLIADCKFNNQFSIKRFLFPTDLAFEYFVKNSKTNDIPSILIDSVPLTLEAEEMMRKSFQLRKYYYDSELRPYHLFLAASQLTSSLFYSAVNPKEDLVKRIENYYIEIGQLKRKNINPNIFNRLIKSVTLNKKN